MKRPILLLAMIFTLSTALTSCREVNDDRDNMEMRTDDMGDDLDDMGDDIEDAVDDTGDAIERSAEEVEGEIREETNDDY